MGTPQCNCHKSIEKWRLFEEDHDQWQKNRTKYAGISPREENYTFYYRWKNKQIKSCQRLADIYEFKLQWEKEHGNN